MNARMWRVGGALCSAGLVVVAAVVGASLSDRQGNEPKGASQNVSAPMSDSAPSTLPPLCAATGTNTNSLNVSLVGASFATPCYYAPAGTALTIKLTELESLSTNGQQFHPRVALIITPWGSPACVHPSNAPTSMVDCSNEGALYSTTFRLGSSTDMPAISGLPAGKYILQVLGLPTAIGTLTVD